jgi:hypothetical protein
LSDAVPDGLARHRGTGGLADEHDLLSGVGQLVVIAASSADSSAAFSAILRPLRERVTKDAVERGHDRLALVYFLYASVVPPRISAGTSPIALMSRAPIRGAMPSARPVSLTVPGRTEPADCGFAHSGGLRPPRRRGSPPRRRGSLGRRWSERHRRYRVGSVLGSPAFAAIDRRTSHGNLRYASVSLQSCVNLNLAEPLILGGPVCGPSPVTDNDDMQDGMGHTSRSGRPTGRDSLPIDSAVDGQTP